MNINNLIKFNEQHKDRRPTESLIYLAEEDFTFVESLDEGIQTPANCPAKLLKALIQMNIQEQFIRMDQAILVYLNESSILQQENAKNALKCVSALYQNSYNITKILCKNDVLSDVALLLAQDDEKLDVVIKNVCYILNLRDTDVKKVVSRLIKLNEHDKEFLKEPLLNEVACSSAEDLLNKLADLTKDRFIIINQYDKKCGTCAVRAPFVWEISRRTWKAFIECVETNGLNYMKFRELSVDQIEKFLHNFKQADLELQELCKKDSLAITCVINDFKYQSFILDSYRDYQDGVRNSIISYALANDKTKFLQLIVNRADLLYVNRDATKLLMQPVVYQKCLDLDTMHVNDFEFLSEWDIGKWKEFHKIDVMLTMDEFRAIVGTSENYVYFMCEAKKANLINLDAFYELHKYKLLPTSQKKISRLIKELEGRKLSDVHREYFANSDIGYRTLIKLLCLCGLESAKGIQSLWEAQLVFEYFKDVELVPAFEISELVEEKKEILSQFEDVKSILKLKEDAEYEMILKGIDNVYTSINGIELDESIKNYYNYVIKSWVEGTLYDNIYSSDSFRYELEYDLPEDKRDLWKTNLENEIEEFKVREVDSFEEQILLHSKLNTTYSYKTDKSTALSIMDATKKTVAVYHCGDCIGVATLRLTKIGEPFTERNFMQNEVILYLSDITFMSNVSYAVQLGAINQMIVFALQKSYTIGFVLVTSLSYLDKGLSIEFRKTQLEIFNNKSKNPIQYFRDNLYRGSWESKKEYSKSTVAYIK